jgi:hypothetical protein
LGAWKRVEGLVAQAQSSTSAAKNSTSQPIDRAPPNLPVRTPRAARRQLPALLAWLAAAGVEDSAENLRRAEALAASLTPEQLEELGRSLAEPTSALAVFAQFARAQQALDGAPATVEQVCPGGGTALTLHGTALTLQGP